MYYKTVNQIERTKFKMNNKDNLKFNHPLRCSSIYKMVKSTDPLFIICIFIFLNLFIIPIHAKGCLNIWMDGKGK